MKRRVVGVVSDEGVRIPPQLGGDARDYYEFGKKS